MPRPKAVVGAVFSDPLSRTLHVRQAEPVGGLERLLWRQAWLALRAAEAAGWPADGPPAVWANTPSARQVVHGGPGDGGTLVFRFPTGGTAGFGELIGRPGLSALVTIDLGSHWFLGVTFRHAG